MIWRLHAARAAQPTLIFFSPQDLRDIMARHGGGFDNYLARSRVTHIIASQLADTKAAATLRARPDAPPVLRPEWVVDSVSAGRRLPTAPYQLLAGADGRQRTLVGGVSGAPAPALARAPAARGGSAPGPAAAAGAVWGDTGELTRSPPPRPPPQPSPLAAARAAAAAARAACPPPTPPMTDAGAAPGARVAEFFASSRLAFIGSWRARAEALLATLAPPGPPPPPPPPGAPRGIIHIDMDCFFASVAAAATPALRGHPVAVCHGDRAAASSSEVACASYEARAAGVRAGMFLGAAKAACPGLVCVPFDFPAYDAASTALYRVLFARCPRVMPLSVDEAVLDVTGVADPAALAAELRAAVFAATRCTASAGVGPNMLLARLATKAAKPDGLRVVSAADADALLLALPASALPGVGWSARARLQAAGIATVADVRASGKGGLVRALGAGAGAAVFAAALGRDDRPVLPLGRRRTIGAEVNWGVRFTKGDQVESFVASLASDLATRLAAAGERAAALTLKLKLKRPGAPEPRKYMGHGICDGASRSARLDAATADAGALAGAAQRLLRALAPAAADVRGAGLVASKLADRGSASKGGGGQASVAALLRAAAAASPAAAPRAKSAVAAASPAAATSPGHRSTSATIEGWLSASPSDSDGSGDGSPSRARHRRRRPPDLDAVTALSQVNADVFDALPREVQADLMRALPPPVAAGGGGARPTARRAPPPPPRRAPPGRPSLPPASQLDPDVVDALPLAVRRELEAAYGCALGRGGRAPRPPPPAGKQRQGALPPWFLSPSPGRKRGRDDERRGAAAEPPAAPLPPPARGAGDPDFGGASVAAAVAELAACADPRAAFSVAAAWATTALATTPPDAEGALRVARALARVGAGGGREAAAAAAAALDEVQAAALASLGGRLRLSTLFEALDGGEASTVE
jgi:nucleotidyltransferase/DNA polymerase involved in DNA repair